MSTITIVMTTYNGEKYVSEQIDSILASGFQDFELYAYDDGSKDTTMQILQEYEHRFPDKVHAIQNEVNLGVTMNFLNALSRTTTDYVMFSDQDDVWMKHKLAVTLKRMRHMEAQLGRNTPVAVFTDAEVVDRELITINPSFFASGHLNPGRTDLSHMLMENKLIGCTVMVNAALRKILQGSALPRQARYHDWWIGLIAASFGKIGYVKERTLYYRQHGENVVGDTGFTAYLKNRITKLHLQKEALQELYRQAEEFLTLYGDQLSAENREIISQFVQLQQTNFLHRRLALLHYGYLKSGVVRNIGIFIII